MSFMNAKKVDCTAKELENYIENYNKYRWHNMKEDPKDVPNADCEVLAVVKVFKSLLYFKLGYAKNLESVDDWDFEGRKHGGFYDYDSEYGYREYEDVIAWKYIEPFEEVKA